jgi:hypothetical protein
VLVRTQNRGSVEEPGRKLQPGGSLQKVREHLDIVSALPSRWAPEELTESVAAEDEDMAFADAGAAKPREAVLDESVTDPGATL